MRVKVNFRPGGLFKIPSGSGRMKGSDIFLDTPRGVTGFYPAAWANWHSQSIVVENEADKESLRLLGYSCPITIGSTTL